MPHVVIVGGGISGLSLAFRLQQRRPDLALTILESGAQPGGKIGTETSQGFRVERGPNGFLDSKPSTLDLCRDLGIESELIAASEASRKHRFLFLDQQLKALPGGPLGLVRTGLLSWRSKWQLLGEWFRRNQPAADDESVADFFRRRIGREAADVFGDAIVTGIHGGDPELLSARAAFPRITAMEAEHGSVLRGMIRSSREKKREAKRRGEPVAKTGRMWSFRGGLRRMIDAILERLVHQPKLNVAIQRIERTAAGWVVHSDGAESWTADAVVLACPAQEQGAILSHIDPELSREVAGIVSCPIAVVAVGYRQADLPPVPDGFGFIAPQRTKRDLLGVQWCSSIYPERAPVGSVLWRVLCGGWNRPEMVGWDDARLLAAVRAELQLAHGITAEPCFSRIVRWERAIPQYHIGHIDRVARIEQRVKQYPGLFLTGNSYHGVALNDCTERATIVAAQIQASL